jgi:predicted mannosyl-3-phosphoglycerate phosphatase (HAD superfamily)
MSVLIGFYRMAWQTRIFTIALGDRANDLTMLRLVDRPILIPRLDGTFDENVIKAMPGMARANKPGPQGWSGSLLRALQGHKGQGENSPARSSNARARRVLAGA